jgi:two-component system LytT family sensor kinase
MDSIAIPAPRNLHWADQIKLILPHIAFWIFRSLLFYRSLMLDGLVEFFWYHVVWLLPVEILAVYFTAYLLVPKLLLEKKYWWFAISVILSGAFFVITVRLIRYEIIYPQVLERALRRPLWYFPSMFNHTIDLYSFVFLFSGIRVFQSWIQDQKRRQELEKQNLNSELALLRSQINPHFLFNTLNNIDSLVFIDQTKASDAILKLSGIMRYMLYEANTDIVPLEREIEYVMSMIALLKLRLKDPDFIEFDIKGNPAGKQIPPMLLVPFIENAYKHGKKTGKSPGIKFLLDIKEDSITFESSNRYDMQNQHTKDKVGGIGLSNVQRRLILLYDKHHEFEIEKSKGKFSVKLRIPPRPIIS